jgi:hypothetical protein
MVRATGQPSGCRMREYLDRRGFVIVLAALACPARSWARALVPASPGAQLHLVSLDDFLALSVRLTGRERLDNALARTYLDAFTATPADAARLRALLTGRSRTPDDAVLAREIIEAWYTGIYRMDGTPHVATHGGALVWQVLGRPAPGTCVTMTADWSRPPAERP